MPRQKKQYTINLPLEEVKQILTDLTLYAHYHPLIYKVVTQEDYSIIKETPFPWLPIPIQYRAKVLQEEKQVRYEVSRIPLLQPLLQYTLEAIAPQQTKVDFDLNVKGLWGLSYWLLWKMIKAQDALMASIIDKLY